MARRSQSKAKRPAARCLRKAAKHAEAPDVGHDSENDELEGDLLATCLSDEDLETMTEDGDLREPEYPVGDHEDEDEILAHRRRLDDEEAAWQEEALGDWHEMQSYRRECNDS